MRSTGPLAREVARAQRSLSAIYHLELQLRAERFLVAPADARRLLPPRSPRSGVLAVEEAGELWLGLYVDPRDLDAGTIVEETSHLLCLAWHAAHDRPVSQLTLELQGEIDRYAVARLSGDDPFRHFHAFAWADGPDAVTRRRYELAHRAAHRYCRALADRYPARADVPALLAELRGFYRAPGEKKLRLALCG